MAFSRSEPIRPGGLLGKARLFGWRLIAEACVAVTAARLLTLLPAPYYSRWMGALGAETADTPVPYGQEAAHIGRVVEAVARYLPFRALCLQCAIATRMMLQRRGLASTLYLGLSRDQMKQPDGEVRRLAHAWVRVGDAIVCGKRQAYQLVVIGRFA